MSRDVIDLAKNVKKEADAIHDISSNLRFKDHSGSKRPSSSSVGRNSGATKENKGLQKHIHELESKISRYEEIVEELNDKIDKRDRKVNTYNQDPTDGG